MKKKFISLLTALSLMAAAVPVYHTVFAETTSFERQMENLGRGTVAVKTSGGVYLSWRLLGNESLENQAFDIYRNGSQIYTTGAHDATCYTDSDGTESSSYIVVPAGESISGETAVTPWTTNQEYSTNSIAYKDIPLNVPEGGTTPDGTAYTYTANDMSTGDVDGDGEYELIVKWDPSTSKDNSESGYTGNVYIDAYELDGEQLCRLDLGVNIRAGAHYTQFIVYDFDGDGKSEIALKTAPGSKDGNGKYVSAAGKNITTDSDYVTDTDPYGDLADYRNSSGYILEGPEWLTVFDGETGAALQTIDYDPPRNITSDWGDTYGNRVDRFLAGVAYLDGKTPSLIMTRGYYTYAYAAAYTWDGTNLTEQWLSSNSPVEEDGGTGCTVTYANGTTKNDKTKTLYAQGAHSLSVADVDNDGYDEIIFGSAILDHDGTVLLYDGRGHGDAEHVSDFDNDGQQEIFMVHEEGKGNGGESVPYAVDIKRYNGDVMTQAAAGDIGRGVMANIDDDYAATSGNLAAFWSVADGTNLYNQNGEAIGNIPNSNNNNFENFFIYWDGDLGRELLDGTMMAKQDIGTSSTTRIYYDRSHSSLPDVSSNNSTKKTPGLVADILGDWREEVIYPLSDGTGARIYFSTIPTTYRLTTLMHDSQYRCAIAWQNVGYNQPPHQSYYIGTAALAKDSDGKVLNYLEPETSFTKVTYPDASQFTPRPTQETPKTSQIKITASKVRNEIGSEASESEGNVWLNYYNNSWGAAYFGFENISSFNPDLIEKAEISFTAVSYGTDKRDRQFTFDLFGTDSVWEAGTYTVTSNPYPSGLDLISSTSCQTNYGNGDILVPNSAAAFDITDYVKSLAAGTEEISIIAAIASGSDGAGACQLYLKNTPVLTLTVKNTEPTAAPDITPEPTATAAAVTGWSLVKTQNFEDDETAFTNLSENNTNLLIQDGDGSNTSKVLAVAGTGSMNDSSPSRVARAQFDFSNYVQDTEGVRVEFDASDFTQIGDTRINYMVIDNDERNITKGSDVSTGTFYQIGNTGSSNSFKINSAVTSLPENISDWVHITVDVNYSSKTLDYTVKSLDGNTTYFSASNASYNDTNSNKVTGLEIINWNPTTAYIDNIKIYKQISYTSEDSFEFDEETGTITGYTGSDTDVLVPPSINGVTVTKIGDFAFISSDITSITLPETVTEIGRYAFASCYLLTSASLPDSLEVIGEYAFYRSGLTSIRIPDGVTSMESSFSNCYNLKTVEIGKCPITDISYSTFMGSNSIESFTVSEENENYASYDGVLFSKDKSVIYRYPPAKEDTSYTIDSPTTTVNYMAFAHCGNLTELNIGKTVTSIGYGSAYDCSNLKTINVDSENTKYVSVDGVLYTSDKDTLVQYPADKADAEYTITASIIKAYAMASTNNLKTVNITSEEIETLAFSETSAETIYINEISGRTSVNRNALCSENLKSLYLYGNLYLEYDLRYTIDIDSTTVYLNSTNSVYREVRDTEGAKYVLLDATPEPTATAAPTATAEPTATAAPTASPSETAAPTVTAAPTSTPSSVTVDYRNGSAYVSSDEAISSAAVIFAAYKDDKLVSVSIINDTEITESETEIEPSDEFKSASETADKICVFVWDSVKGMKPLTDKPYKDHLVLG